MRNAEPESIDAPLQTTAPHEWLVATGLVLSLVLVLAWSTLGRIEVNLRTEGVLVQPGERIRIVSAAPGRVLEMLVRPGAEVAAGAPVARLAPAGLEMRLRVAAAREALLADLVDESGAGAGPALVAALAGARAERIELVALETTGSTVVSTGAGEITALRVAVGDAVDAGAAISELRLHATGPLEAIAFLAAGQAQEVRPGMAARVLVAPAAGAEPRALRGEVVSVTERGTLPWWLNATTLGEQWSSARRGRLVRISIAGGEVLRFDDLQPVRIEILLERVAPLTLLGAPRGET